MKERQVERVARGDTPLFISILIFYFLNFYFVKHLLLEKQINKRIKNITIELDMSTDWKVVQINNKFSFQIPPSVIEVECRSIDSYSRHWIGDDITINFDYGRFSDPLTLYSRKKSYQITEEKINNYSARIVSFQRDTGWNFIGVHFHDLGKNKFDQTVKLTLVVETGPKIDKEIGSRIVKSISLHQPHSFNECTLL